MEKRELSGREKDEASIKLLKKLNEQLYSTDASNRRRAAYKLSWMQEDGLEILKEALFNKTTRQTKSAAAYGLRKMRGRMEKAAIEVLWQGLKNPDTSVAKVCENALMVLKSRTPDRLSSKIKIQAAKIEIKQISRRGKVKKSWQNAGRQRNNARR